MFKMTVRKTADGSYVNGAVYHTIGDAWRAANAFAMIQHYASHDRYDAHRAYDRGVFDTLAQHGILTEHLGDPTVGLKYEVTIY